MPDVRSPAILACIAALACTSPVAASAEEPLYQTPAAVNDFPDQPDKHAEVLGLWNAYMTAFAEMARAGNPWSNHNDAPRDNYVNRADVGADEATVVQPITWTAFPNKVDWYFSTSQFNPYKVDGALLYPLVDEGRLDPDSPGMKRWLEVQKAMGNPLDGTLAALLKAHPEIGSTDLVNFAPLKIPTEICPVVNWSQAVKDRVLFSENISGPRGWKDEYNEWVVERDDAGNLVKVNFTAENPEYWFTVWEVDPDKVLELYRQLTERDVQMEDLWLRDAAGDPVMDARGKPAYNPLNKWNYGNNALPDMGGAIHLTSPPNTVGAEIYLGGAATMIRDLEDNAYSPANNICAAQYGGPFRNSDPNIGMQANQVTRNIGVRLTLTNPIALYMQVPDFSSYVTPDGTDAAEFFHIVRGRTASEAGTRYDQILHATFAVPADKGYTISDITINGTPIVWGSQIAETFNQALAATAYTGMKVVDATRYPPVEENSKDPNGWAQPLVTSDVFWAVNNSETISAATIPLLPLTTTAGTTLENMALEVISGSPKATIAYVAPDGALAPGIAVNILDAKTPDGTSVAGEDKLFDELIYEVTITVGADVTPGQYGVRVHNPGAPEQVPTPGNLIILDSY